MITKKDKEIKNDSKIIFNNIEMKNKLKDLEESKEKNEIK